MIRMQLQAAKEKKNMPEFVDTFNSSNIDALAYDPVKKQLWVRFKGNDVYTYFDVPLQVYRGFWSAPSKGHYFWEKIRKNKNIKHQKLGASLSWIPLPNRVNLNSSKQANLAQVMSRVKQLAKEHADWGPAGKLQNIFNGKRLDFPSFALEAVGYGNKVRLNIVDKGSDAVYFSSTALTETNDIAPWIAMQVRKAITKGKINPTQSIKAAKENNTTIQELERALLQLCGFLQKAMPEEDWTCSGPKIKGKHYLLQVSTVGPDDVTLDLTDFWTTKVTTIHTSKDSLVNDILSIILAVALGGAA